MPLRWLAAAFLLSIAVPLGEGLFPELTLARGSLAALAILPWLCLAPLPRHACEGRGPAWREAAFIGCLALPPLSLGAGLDLARGAEPRALASACAGAWLALCLWTAAAEYAARASGARTVFAALWLVLLPGAAALRLALAWVPRRASESESAGTRLLALDPLLWCQGWGRAGGLQGLTTFELLLAVLGALLVLLAVLALRSRAGEERAG